MIEIFTKMFIGIVAYLVIIIVINRSSFLKSNQKREMERDIKRIIEKFRG